MTSTSSGHDADTETYPIGEQIDSGPHGGTTIAAPFPAPIVDRRNRARNWAAVLLGPNAARMERRPVSGRWRSRERCYESREVAVGDAVEIGADYVSSRGIRYGCRRYYVVENKNASHLVLREYPTAAQAIRAARQAAAEEATAWA